MAIPNKPTAPSTAQYAMPLEPVFAPAMSQDEFSASLYDPQTGEHTSNFFNYENYNDYINRQYESQTGPMNDYLNALAAWNSNQSAWDQYNKALPEWEKTWGSGAAAATEAGNLGYANQMQSKEQERLATAQRRAQNFSRGRQLYGGMSGIGGI